MWYLKGHYVGARKLAPLMLPSALYIMPTEGLGEGVPLKVLLISGFETPPAVGAKFLVIPLHLRPAVQHIKWLYTVVSATKTDDRDWPWELKVRAKVVATPRRWYDITEAILDHGLVPIVGALGGGDRISDAPTIQLIYEMLGEA